MKWLFFPRSVYFCFVLFFFFCASQLGSCCLTALHGKLIRKLSNCITNLCYNSQPAQKYQFVSLVWGFPGNCFDYILVHDITVRHVLILEESREGRRGGWENVETAGGKAPLAKTITSTSPQCKITVKRPCGRKKRKKRKVQVGETENNRWVSTAFTTNRTFTVFHVDVAANN